MIELKPIIFVVDDDPAVLKSLSRALEQHGHEVHTFSNAPKFLSAFDDQHGCLILDLSMPEMNGLKLQQELASRQIGIPIIFITGHGGVPETVQAVKAGAIDFLEKPFLIDVLLQRIDEALQQDYANRESIKKKNERLSRFSLLTDREQDVFKLLISSDTVPSSKEIARDLDISHRTVEHHRSRILEKTQTQSVTELRLLAGDLNLAASPLFEDSNVTDNS